MSGATSAAANGDKKLAIRVRCKTGKNAILRDISTQDTVASLLTQLERISEVPPQQMALLKGFPPKRINFDPTQLIETLGLELQDTLIVELDPDQKGFTETKLASNSSDSGRQQSTKNNVNIGVDVGPNYQSNSAGGFLPLAEYVMHASVEGILMRHVVPSDNSCLFSSVVYCLSGLKNARIKSDDITPAHVFLRQMISATVLSDPEKYNEAFLGKPNGEYVKWIQRRDSWGGGIELSILTEFYGVEIDVVDIQSLHISRFGEDKNYSTRIFLIYDGIHYDSLYLEPFNIEVLPQEDKARTVFSTSDQTASDMALELAREAKATHQFTDLKNFTLKCLICHELLKGQEGAQAHAKNTGHASFAETS